MRGKFLLVVGPSGSGKDTLIKHARSVFPDLGISVSPTTRAPRPGEEGGVDYHFLTEEEFKRRIEAGDFLEWAQYGGNYYGTLRSEVMPAVEAGKFVISDIEVQGARQILSSIPNDVIVFYIDSGPWESLVERIRARAPISDEELTKRYERYQDELSFKKDAHYVITNENGKLEEAKAAFVAAIEAIRKDAGDAK